MMTWDPLLISRVERLEKATVKLEVDLRKEEQHTTEILEVLAAVGAAVEEIATSMKSQEVESYGTAARELQVAPTTGASPTGSRGFGCVLLDRARLWDVHNACSVDPYGVYNVAFMRPRETHMWGSLWDNMNRAREAGLSLVAVGWNPKPGSYGKVDRRVWNMYRELFKIFANVVQRAQGTASVVTPAEMTIVAMFGRGVGCLTENLEVASVSGNEVEEALEEEKRYDDFCEFCDCLDEPGFHTQDCEK
ncbi:hypothetical protein JMJ35_003512 [Cladonia borealis]|uniref:Uncharacterized protein n=1 Tax=Cladonia borealis TaxID=184061 RepID=A0AA39R2T0_9LECA|nr:hypothetical protein JMJ35_003512 [Cladonia borealis]